MKRRFSSFQKNQHYCIQFSSSSTVSLLVSFKWNYHHKNQNEHRLFCGISNALGFLGIQNLWCCQHKVMKDNLSDLVFFPKYMGIQCFNHYSDSLKPLGMMCWFRKKKSLTNELGLKKPRNTFWVSVCDIILMISTNLNAYLLPWHFLTLKKTHMEKDDLHFENQIEQWLLPNIWWIAMKCNTFTCWCFTMLLNMS